MSDLFGGTLPVTLAGQIAEVEREIRLRERVYPNWIANGRLSKEAAIDADPMLTDEEWEAARALAAIRCVAEATREASEGALDSAVAFALNVKISGEYGWTAYMRDLHRAMHAASVLGEAMRDAE